MNTTTAVPLAWINDTAGYQCPHCSLFVCIPNATAASIGKEAP